MDTKGTSIKDISARRDYQSSINVLDKSIFSNVFGKDIRRVYLYKKAERIAQAIHLLAPAYAGRRALGERLDRASLALIDASILPVQESKQTISEVLLTLSSLLAVSESARLLSPMNVSILVREVEDLLTEISSYEEPRVALAEDHSLARVFHEYESAQASSVPHTMRTKRVAAAPRAAQKGTARTRENAGVSQRQQDITRLIKDKREVYIKDISSVMRDVSEKTIQRELAELVHAGVLEKTGERRWTRYRLA